MGNAHMVAAGRCPSCSLPAAASVTTFFGGPVAAGLLSPQQHVLRLHT